jgi:hypothetical protein
MNYKIFFFAGLLAIAGIIGMFAGCGTGPILVDEGFESGDLSGWEQERCCDYSIQIVDSPVRAGDHAARFEARKDQPDVAGSKRAEIVQDYVPPRSERWYAMSLFLPNGYSADPTAEIVAQWHGLPDFDEGETWREPPLKLATENGEWEVTWRYDSRAVTPEGGPEGGATKSLGVYREGRWTDWVFHVQWSWTGDGLTEIWKNGELVFKRQGPNAYNDNQGPCLKTGMYKWPYKVKPESCPTDRQVIYIDEIRIADESATYDDIALPSGSGE